MDSVQLLPIIVNDREAHIQFTAMGLQGAIVYGRVRRGGPYYELDLDSGFIHESNHKLVCDGARAGYSTIELRAEAIANLKAKADRARKRYAQEQTYDALSYLRDVEREWMDEEYIRNEMQSIKRLRNLPDSISLPRADSDFNKVVERLITMRANAIDLFPFISRLYQVPQFHCKSDKFSNGWYVTEGESQRDVEWLLNLISTALKR